MKIAIIGAGIEGLSIALNLLKLGFDVTIFEKYDLPGGLASGFKEKNWRWTLDKYYHHFFTNDKSALNLAKEVGHEVLIIRPKTSVYIDGKIYQLDSPLKVLTFPKLNIFEKIRMAFVLAFFKFNPFWKMFEDVNTVDFLPKAMGKKAYEMIWKPQLIAKFGNFSKDISLAWFWARINKRTTKLAYPKGGFLEFENTILKKIKGQKGNILFQNNVSEINNIDGRIIVKTDNKSYEFDKVIATLASSQFSKIVKNLPDDYQKKTEKIKVLGVLNLVLRLKEKFFKDNTYWLSICDNSWPIMAIVEHTNFVDKKEYGNEHLLYLGKYLQTSDDMFSKSKDELLKICDPFLKKINENYRETIIDYRLFKDQFAQPVVDTNYSKNILPFKTPIENVYLANMEHVYPWDRGTNYAILMGEKIAGLIKRNEI
ncbi:MAG: FAD-dependent oxidoreductase [Patescibacteria group bacterium]|nr:FAD-dependent oxidoreductase [Patescibacteria group bacterium]